MKADERPSCAVSSSNEPHPTRNLGCKRLFRLIDDLTRPSDPSISLPLSLFLSLSNTHTHTFTHTHENSSNETIWKWNFSKRLLPLCCTNSTKHIIPNGSTFVRCSRAQFTIATSETCMPVDWCRTVKHTLARESEKMVMQIKTNRSVWKGSKHRYSRSPSFTWTHTHLNQPPPSSISLFLNVFECICFIAVADARRYIFELSTHQRMQIMSLNYMCVCVCTRVCV